jgi:2-polyprenyl-6-methoxyphenol hydroxylase-like FAD-dependent oxidoreductase
VEVVERQHFPRFPIGESLLLRAMAFLEEAGLLDSVMAAKFQYKNGAIFRRGDEEQSLDCRDKSASGWGTTFHVRRDLFGLATGYRVPLLDELAHWPLPPFA